MKTALEKILSATRNRPDGTGVGILNGDPNVARYIHRTQVPLREVSALLMGSDGLIPAGWDEREPTDRRRLLGLAQVHGIRGIVEHARAAADDDPHWTHIRYKHLDDATGIYVRFGTETERL